MATYTIVDKDKNPLDPGEIHAGDVIQVSDGDVFIIAPSANANITFRADGGGPADFDIVFNDSNANSFNITVENDLIPSIDIANNADLAEVDLNAKDADGVEFTASDNVSFGKFEGSETGANIIAIGNGFTTTESWMTGNGDDSILIGDDATFADIDTGGGNDDVTFCDNLDADDVKTGEGDDTIRSGQNAQAATFDGGAGNDSHNSETTGTNSTNFESNNVVCFARGMTIETINGPVAVEYLKKGMLIETVDNDYQPIIWMGSFSLDREALAADRRRCPIRISANALGPDIPARDLIVSRQHRILVRSPIVRRMFGHAEIFVPALLLTELPGVDVLDPSEGVEYYHFLLNRHEVVFSHGVETENLFLGSQTLKTLSPHALLEIEALRKTHLPKSDEANLARPVPKERKKLRQMLRRHIRNRRHFQLPQENVRRSKVG